MLILMVALPQRAYLIPEWASTEDLGLRLGSWTPPKWLEWQQFSTLATTTDPQDQNFDTLSYIFA